MTGDESHDDFALPGEDVLIGCGYCMTCGYGDEPSSDCLHKRPVTETPTAVIFAALGKSCSLCDDGREPCACGLVVE